MSDKDFSKKIHIKSDSKLKNTITSTDEKTVFRKTRDSQNSIGKITITSKNGRLAKAIQKKSLVVDKSYSKAKTLKNRYKKYNSPLKKRLLSAKKSIQNTSGVGNELQNIVDNEQDTDESAVEQTKSAFRRPAKKSIRLVGKGFDSAILNRNKYTTGKKNAGFTQTNIKTSKKGTRNLTRTRKILNATASKTGYLAKSLATAVKGAISSLGSGTAGIIAIAVAIIVPIIIVITLGGGLMNIINSSDDGDDSDITNAPVSGQSLKNALEIDSKLKSLGFTLQARAGALGVFQNESNFLPDAYNPSGQVGGFAQWGIGGKNGARIETNSIIKGTPPKNDSWSLSNEIKLMDYELNNGYKFVLDKAKKATNSENFAKVFVDEYEGAPGQDVKAGLYARAWEQALSSSGGSHSSSNILKTAKSYIGWFHYPDPIAHNVSMIGGSTKHPNREGQTDCSGFVWLVLENAGYRVPPNMGWFTGSMTADARGSHKYLKSISEKDAKAGDIVIVNQGGGAGANGHTAILAEDWHGANTKIVQMGGAKSIVNQGQFGSSFSILLSGGDICLARAVK